MTVKGIYVRTAPEPVEASFNGGAWATISTQAYPGINPFTGTLSNQPAGQGSYRTRWTDILTYIQQVSPVGIGDVFLVAGQSNAGEVADNNQAYTHPTLKAGCYVDGWRELATGAALSFTKSCWPLVATQHMANQGVSIGFAPCGEGSTSISDWQKPGALYDRITTVFTALGNAKCLLWQQGETDAGEGMSQLDYQNYLSAFVDSVFADTGLDVMISKLHTCSAYTSGQRDTINAAIDYVWTNNAHALPGPDFSDYTTATVHFQTDAEIAVQASRWWSAIKAAFGW